MTMSTQNKSMQEDEEGDEMNFSDEEGGLNVDGIYIPPPPEPYCSSENKGPRLIITKITNHFFKSYANNQELGPFHKCFNAIVGPNGSGKSNVIDSLLFVFGYRASKIRSKKISVLLHNSEKYSNVNSCTVSVHFCLIEDREGDDYDIVEGSEFVVARTAHKDNSSYYTLNGRKAQFKEIGKLLKSHGIDLDHNRFLILQGEVEQISLMSPKGTDNEPGMLEYLEDIIGTTRYKVPLAKLSHRVEELSEKRSEKLNRLKIVQTELDELKGPKDEAVEFLKLENDIITKKNFIYQKTVASLEEAAVGVNNDKEKIDGALEELRGRLKEIGKEKKLKAEKLHEVSQKCDSLQKRKECLKIAFDKANTKDIQLQAEMTEINKKRKRTKELLEEEKKNLENYKRTPEESVKKIEKIESKDADLLSKKEELEEKKIALLASIRNETKALQAEKEALQNKLIGLNKIVDDNKSAYTLAESELKLYTSTQENETRKYENLKKTQETSEAKIASNGNELRKLELMIPESENQIEKATRELVVLKNEEMKILTELRKKRSNLEEVTSSMQASRSKGRVLDSLMQQKMEGRCPGLFGRLGDLGAIDPKYDVAVSTACGALDHIIVDTVDTAQWCIEFLKKHDVGRANFIALEKQEHLWNYCRNRIETPEGVPRLFDLIRVEDERVLPAFYYALRNTLVAKDLEQGSRIGYGAQRYRVVTLGGDLIETTGTMSGGGKQVSRGRMGQSVATLNVSTQDIDKMETDVSNLEGRLGEIRQQIMKYENDISDLTPQCRQMKIAFDKLTMELNALKQQQPNLVKQLKAQEAKMKSTKVDASTLKELTNTVNEAKTKYENALANSNEQQEKVDVINQEINEKSCGKMKKLDQELKEVIKTIDKAKADVTKLKVGLKTAERNAIKSEEKIVIMQQDIKNAEDTLRSLKAQRDEIEEDAKKLLSCIEEITSEIENEEDVSEMKGSVDNLTKKENKLKAEIIEVEEEMNTMNEKLNDIKARIKSWLHKIESLKLQEIPDETTTPLKTYTPEELDARDLQSVQKELHAYEEEFKLAKPNLNAITEYNKKQQVFITRAADLNEVTEQRKKIRGYYDNLSTRRKDEFIAGYNIIKLKLKEMYQMITLGGDADFEMLDNFDPFNEGIQFRVRPPKKTWKLITNLSGGEKTLSSLALVFALHYYKPSPLYVMDEIDAALDFKNVSIVGNYIKERTKNAQFIIISLRSNMFELSDYLHGIYKTYNCTQTLTIDPRTLGKLVRTCSENSEEGNENQEDVGFQLFQ